MPDFADRLKLIRTMRELSLEDMAKIVGATKQTLSRYERRDRFPKSPTIKSYAEKLGVEPAWLIGYDDDSPINAPLTEKDKFKMVIDNLCDEQFAELKRIYDYVVAQKKAQ